MIEPGLISQLEADEPVTSLIADRIYPLLLPETPTYPAVTYQRISTVPMYTLEGALSLSRIRMSLIAGLHSTATANS